MFEFFDSIYQYLTVGLWLDINAMIVYVMAKLVIWAFELKLALIVFAWDVGKEVVNQLNLTATMNQAMSNLSSETYDAMAFFRVPDVLNMIMASYPAKLFMRMMGW